MTDQVKELYKGEVLAGNYVSGTQTLYTTDSTKTAVIKDVDIESTGYTTAPTLLVSDFAVATLSANATGSEIVGTSSTIKIKNNQSLSEYQMLSSSYIPDANVASVQFFPATNPSAIFTPSTTPPSVTKGAATTVAGGAFAGSSEIYWAYKIGNFVYYNVWNGNSTSTFYYRNITTGTNTFVNGGNYTYSPTTFDGVNKFYYVKSNSLYVFDALTNTESLVYTGWYTAGSSYPQIWCVNNVIFWKPTYSGGAMFYYNLANGSTSSFSAPSGWYSSDGMAAAGFYDSTTFTYTLIWASQKNSSSFTSVNIASNAAGTSFSPGTPTSKSITLNGSGKAFAIIPSTPAGLNMYSFGSTSDTPNNKIYSMNKEGALTLLATVTDQTFTPYSSGMVSFSTPSSSDLNTYGPKINLRITGVESTL
jgi:hypothetical protein